MIVTIDAGNTRTKWGVFDDAGHLVTKGVIDNTQLDQFKPPESWAGCRRAVISNVAGAPVAEQLASLAGRLALPLLTVKASGAAIGVINTYSQPEQLGSDRWAALVSAWNRYREPCVVATAGTALTVDALSSRGEFLGGLIIPGWRMMQTSLLAGTAELAELTGELKPFPKSTGDAIYSGAWLALAGAVEQVRQSLQDREGRAVRCILSGGDAKQLLAALPSPAEIADNLVLHGLWLIERENA